MAYEKTNWQTGDVITAEKLNHMDQGIEDNSTYIIDLTSRTWVQQADSTTDFAIYPVMDTEGSIDLFNKVYSGKRVVLKTPEFRGPDGQYFPAADFIAIPSKSSGSFGTIEFACSSFLIDQSSFIRSVGFDSDDGELYVYITIDSTD